MVMWYLSVAVLFWQLSNDHIVNVQYKRCTCGFAKTRLRQPSPAFDSLPYPTCTLCRRVRTYVRSVNYVATKWKEVDHILRVWGSVPRALRAAWEPLFKTILYADRSLSNLMGSWWRRFRNATFYYFNLLTVGVLLAISYRYFASFPCSIRSFYGKEFSSALSFKWLKKVIAFLIIFTSTTQLHPSKRLIIIKRMNIKKDEKEKKKETWVQKGKNTRNNWGTDSRETPEELSP